MFSYISQNWRGRPLVSIETIVNLIGATKTKKGLVIQTSVDTNEYAKGTKITDKEIQSLAIERDVFHGEWNYRILPRQIAHVIM
jgi:hypothetical protein